MIIVGVVVVVVGVVDYVDVGLTDVVEVFPKALEVASLKSRVFEVAL